MLDEVVIDAVWAGQFHIWAVRTIDEGFELLTGSPAGQHDPDGQARITDGRLLTAEG